MSNPITQFNEGFFKEAADLKMDTNFLRGLVAENEEAVQKWSAAFDEIEQRTGDKQFRIKLASELAVLLKDRPQTELTKQANGIMDQLMEFAKANPQMVGGGIGGLLGLLLGIGTDHPLMGLLLGGLGGAGLGHWWDKSNSPAAAGASAAAQARDTAAQQAYDKQEQLNAGQLTPEMQQQQAQDDYNNQEFANIGQPTPPSAPMPSRSAMMQQPGQPVTPQATPVVPPPQPAQQQQRGAPMPSRGARPEQFGLSPQNPQMQQFGAPQKPVVPPRPGMQPRQTSTIR